MRKKAFTKERILRRFVEPSKGNNTDTCDTIDFGKEEVFTLTEVAEAIRMKSTKGADEDEIRPEMLKALNGGVRCLTRV